MIRRGRLRLVALVSLAAFPLASAATIVRADAVEGVDAGQRFVDSVDDAGAPIPTSTDAPSADPSEAPSEPAPSGPEEPNEPALPAEHQPTITVRLTPEDGLATGDVVHLEITVEVPEGDDVNIPRQSYAPFELVGQDHAETLSGGRRRFVFTLDLLALQPGDLQLPGTTVRVITSDGVVGTVRTEPRTVRVASLIANEPDAQPRPPTEPVVVMQDDYTLAYVAGALVLMAITALLTWLSSRWWRSRPRTLPPPPPPRPPAEVALEKLRALRRELTGALAEGTQARIVDGASDALREYLGHRFGFNGLESTTDEVIARLRAQRLSGVSVAEVTSLLGDCDLVKFAKAIPDQADCEKVIADAERIVQRTMHANVVAIAPPAPATLKDPPVTTAASAMVPAAGSDTASGSEAFTSTTLPTRVDGSPSSAATVPHLPSFAIPATPVPPPPPHDSEEAVMPAIPATPVPPPPRASEEAVMPAIPATLAPPPPTALETEEAVWARLDDAVAEDRLVVGDVVARREDGFLVRLGADVHGVLPEAQLGGLDPDALVGQERAFRIVSLHAGRKRIVLSHRDVDEADEPALVGRKTPIGFADPDGAPRGEPGGGEP
ncbi:MAG: hypothetical protein OHK0013_32190 [Sandaracinaceae bacterium]